MKQPQSVTGPQKWKTHNGIVIAKSKEHTDLFIINHADNRFHTVTSSFPVMLKKYPDNKH